MGAKNGECTFFVKGSAVQFSAEVQIRLTFSHQMLKEF